MIPAAPMSYYHERVERITGPLSPLQLRAVMVDLACLNWHLKNRPTFQTECDVVEEESRIIAVRPQSELKDFDYELRGKLLYGAVEDAIPNIRGSSLRQDEIGEAIKAGTSRAARRDPVRARCLLWPWSRTMAWRRIKEVMVAADIHGACAMPKGLRHAFGVNAFQAKVPPHLVQRLLGHASVRTTAIYGDVMGPEERSIAARMWSG
jgi:hypothetical protein